MACGRHIVTEEYLIESAKAGYFLGSDTIKVAINIMGVPSEILLPSYKPDIRTNLGEEGRW